MAAQAGAPGAGSAGGGLSSGSFYSWGARTGSGAGYTPGTIVAFLVVVALVALAGDKMPTFVWWSLILVGVFLGLTNAAAVNDVLRWLTGGLASVTQGGS